MNVGFDREIFLLQKYGGVSKYFSSIAQHFISSQEFGINPVFTFTRSDNEYLRKLGNFQAQRKQIRAKGGLSTGLTLGPIRSITQTWSGGSNRIKKMDLLHATYYRPTFLERSVAMKLAITIHDFIPEHLGWTGIRNPHIGKKSLANKSDLIICVSKNTANELSEFYGINDARVKVIPHGVDNFIHHDEFSGLKKFDRPSVLYVGHRFGYKNFDILPQAIKEVRNFTPDVQLVLAGPQLEISEIRKLNEIVGEKNWKCFTFLSDKELSILYAQSHVHCVTSKMEGFGMTTLESLAMGTPVIANDIEIFREVLADSGIYYSGNTADSLASVIQTTLESIKYEEIRKSGIERAQQFTWERSALAHAEAYKELLG